MTHQLPRYTLHAYVCGRSCVKWSQHVGQVTFRQIFVERPDGCRYAVASDVPERVVVWDLYETTMTLKYGPAEPNPVHQGDDVDAAVMATAMMYDDPE